MLGILSILEELDEQHKVIPLEVDEQLEVDIQHEHLVVLILH